MESQRSDDVHGNGSLSMAGEGLLSRVSQRSENVRLRKLLAASEEKAARSASLIREADHRIKNSLQIVSSLMQVQARREESVSARNALKAAASRVLSISRIHDALQTNGGEDVVDLGAVLQTMCQSLHEMAGQPETVSIMVEVEPVHAPIDLAQPIVLMVNELVVNALRHAFHDDRPGTIRVSLAVVDNELRVMVADDGVGLPAEYGKGPGFGASLVKMMTSQIEGVMTVESSSGACFTLTVAAPAAFQIESRERWAL